MLSVRVSNAFGPWQQPLEAFVVLDTSKISKNCSLAVTALSARSVFGFMHALFSASYNDVGACGMLFDLLLLCRSTAEQLPVHKPKDFAHQQKDPSESC